MVELFRNFIEKNSKAGMILVESIHYTVSLFFDSIPAEQAASGTK